MATSQLNCCTCPEPDDFDPETDDPLPKYRHKCGCPTVEIVCESAERTLELCGHSEFSDAAATPPVLPSVPPLKYLTQTVSDERTRGDLVWPYGCQKQTAEATCAAKSYVRFEASITTSSSTSSFDPLTCVESTSSVPENTTGGTQNTQPSCPEDSFSCGELRSEQGPSSSSNSITNTSKEDSTSSTTRHRLQLTQGVPPFTFSTFLENVTNFTRKTQLSVPDTESNALNRAVLSTGTSCSSIDELRTTSFSKTVRTSKYTATASNLVIGVAYQGCISLRRRRAYSGDIPENDETGEPESTEWEDIEPDLIADFTATADTQEIAENEELPNETGWEYQVVSGHVWPTYADCDCPVPST